MWLLPSAIKIGAPKYLFSAMAAPMMQAHLRSTSMQTVQFVPVEPHVKSAETRELFNAGVSENAGTGKSADPACYDDCVE